MFKIILGRLGILEKKVDKLEKKIDKVDQRVSDVEHLAESMLKQFFGFKNRAQEELRLMDTQIQDLLSAVNSLIERSESEEGIARAKALRKRLKNYAARIRNAKEAQAAGG
jgi:uncharacterized coiled-coil DUF342 family protein